MLYVLEMEEQLWYNQNPLARGKALKNACVDYRERVFLFKLIFLDIYNKIFLPLCIQISNNQRYEAYEKPFSLSQKRICDVNQGYFMIHYGKFTSPVTPSMCWNSFSIEREKNEYVRKITRMKRILSIIGSHIHQLAVETNFFTSFACNRRCMI